MNKSFAKYSKGQTSKEFIQDPEFKDFVDGVGFYKWSTDQMLLNWWVKKEQMKVKNMDWRYKLCMNPQLRNINRKKVTLSHSLERSFTRKRGENIEEILKKKKI